MTNALHQKFKECEITQGTDSHCRYDVLVSKYDGMNRDLLIEVKPDPDMGSIRIAIGQLLDYRRFLHHRAGTDLALLTMSRPQERISICYLIFKFYNLSHSHDEINEYAFVVVLQVRQVVGEVGEVLADASLQVLANMTIDRGQRAAAPLTYIGQVKRSHLRQAIPFLEEPPVHAQHRELPGVVEEIRVHAIQTFLSHAVGVLASEGPIRREVVVQIQRRDVALLKELGRGVLQSHLTRGRHVIKVRVLDHRV